MTSFRTQPCNWPVLYCGDGESGASGYEQCASLAQLTPQMAAAVERAATGYLWNWTRRQFGTCPVTVHPCRDQCNRLWSTYRGRGWPTTNLPWFEGSPGPLNPALIGGQWYNLPCGGSCPGDKCSCEYVPTVELAGPVASIDEVVLGGVTLDPADYRVDNFRWLVRTDGGDWPVCNTDFDVTYQIGVEVPDGGQLAAGVLACQMAKAVCGDKGCQLPQRVQQVTRQQVQITMLDNYATLYEFGTTGLWAVDSWVASIMASNRQTGMRVASPDVRASRRTTSP